MIQYDKCIKCPSHRIVSDPDLSDSFCSDDVAVVCSEIKGHTDISEFEVVSCANRPYQAHHVNSPNWCPRKKIMSNTITTETIDIAKWFDVEDAEHLIAYKMLMNTGHWPEGFIPEHVELDAIWQVSLMSMMTAAYIKLKLDNR